jgi:hypothetical protein
VRSSWYYSKGMKLRSTLWIATALLALLGTPSLSCFVPRQLLNANDSDCCRQMGHQCGSTTMPSSQSCCTSPTQVSQPYISSASHQGPSSAGVVLAILPIAPVLLPLTQVKGSLTPDKLQLKITVHDPTIYSKTSTSSPLTYTLQLGVEPRKIIFALIDGPAAPPGLMSGSYTPAVQH